MILGNMELPGQVTTEQSTTKKLISSPTLKL